jgi:hypothetical protein
VKFSLLEIVQEVLNEMDSDFVNSINDTVESQQVAGIAKSCFNEFISNRNWPHLKQLIQLDSSNDSDKPNYLKVPSGVKEMISVRYDMVGYGQTKPSFKDIRYKSPDDFLTLSHSRNLDNSNVVLIRDFSATPLLILNDSAPEYWTTFDDEWLVFDSYDSAVDDTLKKSKTQALVYREPDWVHSDEAIPDLPEEAFAAFIEEVKSTAFLALKQMPNTKAEQKASRQQRWLARKAWKLQGGLDYPDFGRKGRR